MAETSDKSRSKKIILIIIAIIIVILACLYGCFGKGKNSTQVQSTEVSQPFQATLEAAPHVPASQPAPAAEPKAPAPQPQKSIFPESSADTPTREK